MKFASLIFSCVCEQNRRGLLWTFSFQLRQWVFHLIDPFASFNVLMWDIFVCDRLRKAEAHDN